MNEQEIKKIIIQVLKDRFYVHKNTDGSQSVFIANYEEATERILDLLKLKRLLSKQRSILKEQYKDICEKHQIQLVMCGCKTKCKHKNVNTLYGWSGFPTKLCKDCGKQLQP